LSVFKDFPGLENLEKKIKDFQGPAKALYVAWLRMQFNTCVGINCERTRKHIVRVKRSPTSPMTL